MLETETFLVMGASTVAAPVFKISVFKRFSAVREGDSWHVGPNSCDALVWVPNKRIRVFGILLYERYQSSDRAFQLKYRYRLEITHGEDSFKSEVFQEEVDASNPVDHIIEHRFINLKDGVLVEAGQRYCQEMWVVGADRMHYSETGAQFREVQNTDMGLFEILHSPYSENSTTTNRGIIPGIVYSLV